MVMIGFIVAAGYFCHNWEQYLVKKYKIIKNGY
jgi:hypothetical protein